MEFAIAFPILVLLMCAIIDFGINYANRTQTIHAAREGARAAMVNRVGTVTGCFIDTTGPMDNTTRAAICLTKARTQMDPNRVRVRIFYMGPNGKLTTNISNSGNSIVVCTMSSMRSITGLLGPVLNSRVTQSSSVVKTARPVGGVYVQAGAENPLTGANWNWCQADDPVGTE